MITTVVFNRAKLILAAVIAAILFLSGCFIGWKFQSGRVAAVEQEKADILLSVCQDANRENAATIDRLKKDGDKNASSCAARLKIKDDLIRSLKAIQSKTTITHNTGGPNEAVLNPDTDDILDALNRMYPADATDQSRDRRTRGTVSADGTVVHFRWMDEDKTQ